MPDALPTKCCGTCRHWGKLNYGDKRTCKYPYRFVRPKNWPSCLQLEKYAMKATDGQNCSVYQMLPPPIDAEQEDSPR